MESYIEENYQKSRPPFVLFQGTRKESHHGQDVKQEIKGMKERERRIKAGSDCISEINLGAINQSHYPYRNLRWYIKQE